MPGPGEPGNDTWAGDSWKSGGAAVWTQTALDPDLGLIYLNTGNPWPSYNGSTRTGDNLYSSSVVALDAKTGKCRWHYQVVHHDIWDFDAPTPLILFDQTYNGQPRKAIAVHTKQSRDGEAAAADRGETRSAGRATEDRGDTTCSQAT